MSVSAARAERVRWADTAKGVCILLVVLWHVVAKQYLRLDWPEGLRIPGAWGTLGELLLPLRMPLFFTISGMFALGAVQRPWRVSARSRVAKFLYLYVLWLLIHTALLSLAPDFPTDRATNWAGLLEQLTITPSNLWYLYALALYFVIAKATWRLPRVVVLVPALALSIAASAELVPVPGNRAGLFQNLIFFLLGLYFRPYVERLAERANWPRFALAAGVYGGLLLAMFVTGTQDVPGVWPVVCVAAAVFGVVGAAMLARWDRVAAPLLGIGRRTLPIYVIHMPLLALLDLALAGPLSAVGSPFQVPLAVVEPILMTALISWICLLLHRGLEATKLDRFLLDLPGGSKGRHGTGSAPTSTAAPEHASPERAVAPVGVGAHAATHAEAYAVAAHAAASDPGGPPGASWPTGHDSAGSIGANPLPQRPVRSSPGHSDPAAGPHHPHQPSQQGSFTGQAPQGPFADLGPAQPGRPADSPSGFPSGPAAQPYPGYQQPAYPATHQDASQHPAAPAAQPYPDYQQPAYPATHQDASQHPAAPSALPYPGYQQPAYPATHRSASQHPAAPAAQPYPDYQQPAYPPAYRGASHRPDSTDTQPYSTYHQPSHPAVPSADRPAADQTVWPQSPGHGESTYQSPYQPSPARPSSWFEPPQAAQGTSWAPGTAGSGDGHGSGAIGQGRNHRSETDWFWAQDT